MQGANLKSSICIIVAPEGEAAGVPLENISEEIIVKFLSLNFPKVLGCRKIRYYRKTRMNIFTNSMYSHRSKSVMNTKSVRTMNELYQGINFKTA